MSDADSRAFVAFLIRNVRDLAIRGCDRSLPPDGTGLLAAKWRDAMARGEAERTLIADAVDKTLYYLLAQIDSGRLEIRVRLPGGGSFVDLRENSYGGGMAGEYIGDRDLIPTYSEERFEFVDYAADMPAFDWSSDDDDDDDDNGDDNDEDGDDDDGNSGANRN